MTKVYIPFLLSAFTWEFQQPTKTIPGKKKHRISKREQKRRKRDRHLACNKRRSKKKGIKR